MVINNAVAAAAPVYYVDYRPSQRSKRIYRQVFSTFTSLAEAVVAGPASVRTHTPKAVAFTVTEMVGIAATATVTL